MQINVSGKEKLECFEITPFTATVTYKKKDDRGGTLTTVQGGTWSVTGELKDYVSFLPQHGNDEKKTLAFVNGENIEEGKIVKGTLRCDMSFTHEPTAANFTCSGEIEVEVDCLTGHYDPLKHPSWLGGAPTSPGSYIPIVSGGKFGFFAISNC